MNEKVQVQCAASPAVRIDQALTAKIADVLIKKLVEMGDDVRGITWFSSRAEGYAAARLKKAA